VYTVPVENEQTFHQHIFMPASPFATIPGSCGIPELVVLMLALTQVEDILGIGCEL
jgi:hypothetical protein